MGTKIKPGLCDCYAAALPDEPTFTLLARDPQFARLVRQGADQREHDIACGERPVTDVSLVREARSVAAEAESWRRSNLGRWRQEQPAPPATPTEPA